MEVTIFLCHFVRFLCQGLCSSGRVWLQSKTGAISGKGLFTQGLESELLSGRVNCAVHSLEDLPVENPNGLTKRK